MIVVFGASGHIGGELISILSADGVPAIAVTRAAAMTRAFPGIRWVQADLSPASIDGLSSGVDRMFLLTGNDRDMARLQISAINAAAKAHVDYVVNTPSRSTVRDARERCVLSTRRMTACTSMCVSNTANGISVRVVSIPPHASQLN